MCGRFYVDDDTLKEIEKLVKRIDNKRAKTGDVHPSEPAMVLRAGNSKIVAEVMEWGYHSPVDGKLMINARAETVQERPMFRNDYEERRCIIPANKFYEWKKINSKSKEKYEFYILEQKLYLAGIYKKTPQGERFTILTKNAEGCMKEIHHRMPVILPGDELERWLYSAKDAKRLLDGRFHELQKKKSVEEGYEQMLLW